MLCLFVKGVIHVLDMVKGCQVPFPERLFEGCEIGTRYIRMLLDAGRIPLALEKFLELRRREQVFIILELPTNQKEEPEPERVLHKDIYYLDGCSQEQALSLLEEYGELLIQDGMSAFGFGGHELGDEIMVEKYNLVTLWSRRPVKFRPLLEELGLPEQQHLVTAGETFDQEHPGQCQMITLNGITVYDLPEMLKDRGLYFAERRKA